MHWALPGTTFIHSLTKCEPVLFTVIGPLNIFIIRPMMIWVKFGTEILRSEYTFYSKSSNHMLFYTHIQYYFGKK